MIHSFFDLPTSGCTKSICLFSRSRVQSELWGEFSVIKRLPRKPLGTSQTTVLSLPASLRPGISICHKKEGDSNIQFPPKTKRRVCKVLRCFCWHRRTRYSSTAPFKLNLSFKTAAPAWFAGLAPLPSVWARVAPLPAAVFGLSLFTLLPCWAKGVLLQVSMTIVWPAGY